MKRAWIILIALGCCVASWGQNLDKMDETTRNATLVKIAKKAVKKYGPDYYREYGQPEIKHGYVAGDDRHNFSVGAQQKNPNRSYYTVKFFYDKSVEAFPEDYCAWVYIWGDNGTVHEINFGIGMGLSNLDELKPSNTIKRATWKRQPPGKYFGGARAIKDGEVGNDK